MNLKRNSIYISGALWVLGILALVMSIAGCHKAPIYGTRQVDTLFIEVQTPPDSAAMALKLDSACKVCVKRAIEAQTGADTLTTLSPDSLIEVKEFVDSTGFETKIRYKGTVSKKTVICPPCSDCPQIKKPPRDMRSWLRKQFDKVSLEICGFLLILSLVLLLFRR